MRLNRHALVALRERSGLNKSALARTVEISPAHMGDIEAGRRHPSPALCCRFADALKVPLPALLADPNGDEAVA